MGILDRPAQAGAAGALALLVLYFGILTAAQSFQHAASQFRSMWYWILLLSAGFGIQAALYTYVRKEKAASASVAASGGVSATSMVACCAHHLADILPVLGVSAAAVLLARYQTFFIIIGVLSNLNGTLYMLSVVQRHKLAGKSRILKKIAMYDVQAALRISLVLSLIIAAVAYVKA